MILTEKQVELLKRNKTIVLATADKNDQPNAVFVEVSSLEDDTIIITDNHFERTMDNLLENNKVSLLVFEEDYSYHYKIYGESQYFTAGQHLNFVKGLESNKGYSPKGALVIKIKEVRE